MFPLFILLLCAANEFISAVPIEPPKISNYPGCGISSVPTSIVFDAPSKRDVSGIKSQHGEWPWIAAIVPSNETNTRVFCSGVLISDQHIITAANCVYRLNAADITVRLGEHSHRHDSGYERNYSVKSIRHHNAFDKSSFAHNIALIILKNPVEITNSIKPICLAAASLPVARRLASVAGWGTTSPSGEYSDVLRKEEVLIWSQVECREVLGQLDASQMCAGPQEKVKGSCLGDEGSPLMIRLSQNHPWQLVGIVSYSKGCGQSNAAIVYTRIAAYIDWIETKRRDGFSDSSSNLVNIWPESCGESNNGLRSKTTLQVTYVGGTKSKELSWPWMASLLRHGTVHSCGGSVITNRHILTAAHCVRLLEPTDIKVRLGEFDFNVNSTFEVNFAVEKITEHSAYNRRTLAHDIAILKLKEPITFTNRIQPLCLPPKDLVVTGKFATGTGWGRTSSAGSPSPVLQEAKVEIWAQEKCKAIYPIGDDQMCAGYDAGGVDACQGDSGGPLMLKTDAGPWSIVGIVSGGEGCAEPNKPGIYARITAHLDWIRETVQRSHLIK